MKMSSFKQMHRWLHFKCKQYAYKTRSKVSDTDIAIIEKKLLNTHNVIISKKKRIAIQRHGNRSKGSPDTSNGWFNMIKRSVASNPASEISQQGRLPHDNIIFYCNLYTQKSMMLKRTKNSPASYI